MFKSFHNFLRRVLDIENIYDHSFVNIKSKNKTFVLVDMGANKGFFTKAFLRRHSISKAVLIEPNSFLVQELTSDFKDRNVHILNAAVGARVSGGVPFYLSQNSEASSLNKEVAEVHRLVKEGNQVCIRMTTMKEVCSLFDLTKIDLLKVDIEGGEYDVLESLSKEEFKKIDQISIEFHDFMDPSLRKRTENCIKRLRSSGYLFIHASTSYMYGSPYYNCLFFKKRIAILGFVLVLWREVRSFMAKIGSAFTFSRNR